MPPLYTIGHSTRELDAFLELLRVHGIERIVDVRRYPGSRRHPHFGSEALQRSLREAGFDYRHAPELGGRRRPAPDSANDYWRNDSFRAYADYMATPAFRDAVERVLADSAERPTAVMCAEAVPWRCHRNLISDAAVAAGTPVEHVIDVSSAQPHVLNPAARVRPDGALIYPGSSEAGSSEPAQTRLEL